MKLLNIHLISLDGNNRLEERTLTEEKADPSWVFL